MLYYVSVHSFLWQVLFHCMDILNFLLVGLFTYFGYYELYFCEHLCIVYFSWVYTEEWNFGMNGNSMFNVLRNCQTIFKVATSFLYSDQ